MTDEVLIVSKYGDLFETVEYFLTESLENASRNKRVRFTKRDPGISKALEENYVYQKRLMYKTGFGIYR